MLFLDFSLRINQGPDQVPEVGEDIQFECEIDEKSPFANPVWYNPAGEPVLPPGEGKEKLFLCLRGRCASYPKLECFALLQNYQHLFEK